MSVTSPASPPAAHADVVAGRRHAALTISGWNALSRVTGFVRVLAVAGALGATFLGNTYHSANLISTLTFELLAAGLLSAPLVPALVGLIDGGRSRDAESLAGTLLGVSLVGLGVLALAMALAGPALMRLLTAGVDDPVVRAGEVRLGAFLLWFFLPQMLLYAAGAVASAYLNARRRFAAAAFAPVANNAVVTATMIAFVAVTSEPDGDLRLALGPRLVLAVGTSAGVLAMAAVPVVALRRAGVRLRPRLDLGHPALPAVLRACAWGVLLLAAVQVLLAATLVLANQVEGGVVAYQIAYTFFLLPFALIAHPIFTALHPGLSSAAHAGRWDDFASDLATGLGRTLLLVLPAAALLATLAHPLLGLLRVGALDGPGASLVARVLAAYAMGLAGYAAFQLLVRAATAAGDARLPAVVGMGVAAGGTASMVVASAVTSGESQVVALGAAQSIAMTVGAVALYGLFRRRVDRPLHLAPTVARAAAASLAVAGATLAGASLFDVGGRGGALVDLVVAGPLGVAAGVATLWALRSPELADLRDLARARSTA